MYKKCKKQRESRQRVSVVVVVAAGPGTVAVAVVLRVVVLAAPPVAVDVEAVVGYLDKPKLYPGKQALGCRSVPSDIPLYLHLISLPQPDKKME
ncbi:hypothetical protein TorRG33x02_268730 [Trema orientale]|uniref:Uncharacterized protein n=1 Tax=Trema orientale TaxID=63057 RepID=A0A2P5CYQ3_TREOI|nr:hypothetical protein TorRG33x02_268730 [Trema orientale]